MGRTYGSITIVDTTDIEQIYMVYAGSSSDTQAPDKTNFNLWKTDISQVSGSYIWQRTVVKKSGIIITSSNFQEYYGDPVCITGPEGGEGKGITSITIEYCNYGSGTPADSGSHWKSAPPAYDSSKPNYWTKTTINYTTGDPTIKKIKDNGLTDAIRISNDANTTAGAAKAQAETAEGKADQAISTANAASSTASNAYSIATGTSQHFWIEAEDYAEGVPAGVYITQELAEAFKLNKTGGNIITRYDGIWIRDGVNLLTSLTNNALTFYNPSLSTKGIELDSTALKFYDQNETIKAFFGRDEIVMGQTLTLAGNNNNIVDSSGNQLVDSSGNSIVDFFAEGVNSEGYNTRIDANGFYVRDGLTPVATFGTETTIYTTNGDELVHFGYDEGISETGTEEVAPYYTLGFRARLYTIGNYSMVEGFANSARGFCSHAEGVGTNAISGTSHSEGFGTDAIGYASHSEGQETVASGDASHAQNYYTIAASDYQTAIGKYNISDSNDIYALIVGNGYLDDTNNTEIRSNAFAVDWSGNAYCYPSQINLGRYISSGFITNTGGQIIFSIPLGRVLPSSASISSISFNIVARAASSTSSSNTSGGFYCIKSAASGTSAATFNSASTSITFYDAGNNSRTLTGTTFKNSVSIQGGTNILVNINSGTNYFFTGNATNLGYLNNQPVAVDLQSIVINLTY